MTFAEELIKNIKEKNPIFNQQGSNWTYAFVRVPSANPRVETLLYGKAWNGRDELRLMDNMEKFCTLVDNVAYGCAYIGDVERNERPDYNKFFTRSFGAVADELSAKVSERLVAKLESMTDEELVPDAEQRAGITNEENLANNLRREIILGEAPEYHIERLSVSDIPTTAIGYLLDSEKAIKEMYDEFIADDKNEYGAWRREKLDFFVKKTQKAYFEAHKDALSDNDKLIRTIQDTLAKAQELGAKSVTMFVDGDDSLIKAYVRKNYPDFSIDGKVLELKVRSNLDIVENLGKISAWDVSVENVVLKKQWSNKKEDFLSDFFVDRIQRIVYRKKDLYCKGA